MTYTVLTWYRTMDLFLIGKGVGQGCILYLAYLTYTQSTSCEMPGLDEAQGGIKISGRNINNLRYADATTLTAYNEEELKSLLRKVKEESKKAGLELNIQKMKIMSPGPITSWQIDGETMETVRDFIFLGPQITADGHCSHELKRCLSLGRKAMTNIDSILKSRDLTLPTKFHLVKAMVFPVVMYRELDHKEGWALENWCFWTVELGKTLESPLDCKESQPVNTKGNQSRVFIESTDAEAKAPVLWPPDVKNWLIGKDPDAGKDWRQEEKGRGWDGWMASPTQWTWVWANSMSWWWTGKPGMLQSTGLQRVRQDWATGLNWTELNWF